MGDNPIAPLSSDIHGDPALEASTEATSAAAAPAESDIPVMPDADSAPVLQNAPVDPPAEASSAPLSVPPQSPALAPTSPASPALTPTTPTPDTEIVATNVAVKKGFMPAKMYDILKWIALIFLPAAGTLYFGLAGIWDWPNEDKILATVTAFDTFLGILLGISTLNYNKATPDADGDMILDTSHPEKDVLRMALNGAPEDLLTKDKVVFRVVK